MHVGKDTHTLFWAANNGLQMFDLGVSGVRIRFLFGLDGVDPIEM